MSARLSFRRGGPVRQLVPSLFRPRRDRRFLIRRTVRAQRWWIVWRGDLPAIECDELRLVEPMFRRKRQDTLGVPVRIVDDDGFQPERKAPAALTSELGESHDVPSHDVEAAACACGGKAFLVERIQRDAD